MKPKDRPSPTGPGSRSLRDLLFSEVRGRDFGGAFRRDLRDLYRFYLDEEARARLAEMGRVRRWIKVAAWTLKSLLAKLSPPRRLLLAASIAMFILGRTGFGFSAAHTATINLRPWGFALLLLVLMLELKDKLLARDEIEMAREVQLALLPREHPDVPGWSLWSSTRPANDAGGDLVDYIPLGSGSVGVALGDVAGKGLGAALLMARLQATLRALAPGVSSFAALGGSMNDIFERDGPGNRFATLFLFRLDGATPGRLRYLNAGHDPPFVVRAAGLDELPASAVPLGMFARAEYSEGAAELAPGDLLVVYSDGVIDARNPAGEEFGRDRLRALLPGLRGLDPAEAGRRLLLAVDDFLAGERPSDDLSLVLARRV